MIESPLTLVLEMPSGSPEALCVFTRPQQNARGIIFSRSAIAELRDQIGEDRDGVYVLWDDELWDDETPSNPRVYIGEGSALARIGGHEREKAFWSRGAVFISSDASLHKTVGKRLEAELVRLAKDARRCTLENKNSPQFLSLGAADRDFATGCLSFIRLCLRVAGVRFLEKPAGKADDTPDLYLKAKNIKATGYESEGFFIVKEGSQAVKNETPSIHAWLSSLRKDLITNKVLLLDGDVYRVTRDYEFKSPSAATGALLGSIPGGLTMWKNEQGKTLRDIQAERE